MSDLLFSLTALAWGQPKMDPEFQAANLTNEVVGGQTIIEIGANKGGLTILLSRLVGDKGKVISFEPNPWAFGLLSKYTSNMRNVQCFNLGVGNIDGQVKFVGKGPTDSSFRMMWQDNSKMTITTKIVRLDDFICNLGLSKVDWLFIDAEGAELGILLGARETIIKMRPRMYVETHPCFVPGIHEAVVKYLEGYGYTKSVVYNDPIFNVITYKFVPS